MKSKNLSVKLLLNKQTIAHLSPKEQENIIGGWTTLPKCNTVLSFCEACEPSDSPTYCCV